MNRWLRLAAPCFLVLLIAWSARAQEPSAPADKKDDKGPFQELKFRNIGPAAGGRVSRAQGVAGDPMTYYAGTASGGVWKTTDGGLTWKPIFDDQPTSSIGALAVAPSDPNVIYVGSGEANIRGNVQPGNGIYKSTDGGKSWKHIWKQKGQIGQMIVHPKNANIAYAAVLGHAFGPNAERGVYRTADGGRTWLQVLKKDIDTGAIDICFDPQNPRILFACLWQARRRPWEMTSGGPGSGLYRSDDAGDTWKKLGPEKQAPLPSDAKPGDKQDPAADESDNGLPPGPWGRCAVAVAPSDSRRVYLLIEADKGGLYRSDDGGEKWSYVNPNRYLRIRPWYFTQLTIDPSNPDVVYAPSLRLLKSIDGGKTFKNLKGPHHVDHHDLWIDPRNPRRMIDSNDGGVDITTNGGKSWYAPPLPICQFYHINVDNRVPYHVSGTMQDMGTASGPSNSLCSDGIMLRHWHTVGGGETGFTMPHPTDPNIVFAGEYGGYLSRYDHRTRQARNISIYPTNPSGHGAEDMKYRFQWTAPVLISPHDSSVVYHAGNRLFRTQDAGKSWTPISPDLTRNDTSKQQWSGGPITGDNTTAEYYCTIFAIAESSRKAGVLWAGSDDGLVHVSTDGGTNWTNVTMNIKRDAGGFPDWATVCCIEASRRDPGTAYVVVDAHRLDDDRPYLFKTSDFGQTWKKLTDKLPPDDYVRVVREDPSLPGMLHIGTEQGLYYSRDDGGTWDKLKLNLPTVAVSDLVVKDNDLVVGTNGRSIWILDDLTPLRLGAGVKGPNLYAVPLAYRWRQHSEIGEDRWTGDNPKGALISYYLDKKPKDLTMEIHGPGGVLVRKIDTKKDKDEPSEDDPDAPWTIFKKPVLTDKVGVNRIAWDLSYEGAKLIPGAKNDGGTPQRGPLVNPGSYTVKLMVDGQTLESTVEVRLDNRVKFSGGEAEEQLKLSLALRGDITRLSEAVISMRKVKAQLQSRNELIKDDENAKDLIEASKKLMAKLDKLEAELHNPKAQVTYDILAMKGGAKLYSQLAQLYEWIKDSDGPVTQGMREVYQEQRALLEQRLAEWTELRRELARLNDEAKKLDLPHVLGF